MNGPGNVQFIGRFNVSFCGVIADEHGTLYETVRIEEFDGGIVVQDKILYLTWARRDSFEPFTEFSNEQKILQYLKYPNYTRLHVSEYKVQYISSRKVGHRNRFQSEEN